MPLPAGSALLSDRVALGVDRVTVDHAAGLEHVDLVPLDEHGWRRREEGRVLRRGRPGSAMALEPDRPDVLPLPTMKAPMVPITRPSRMANRESAWILLRPRTTTSVKIASAMLLGDA